MYILNKINYLKNLLLLSSFSIELDMEDIIAKQRFRLFKTASFITVFVFFVFTLQVIVIKPGSSVVLYTMFFLFFAAFANYFTLLYHKKISWSIIIILMLWFLLIHVNTYNSAGIKNSANIYLTLIILTAFMQLGRIGGTFFTALTFLHLLYFFWVSIFRQEWINDSFIGDQPNFDFLYYFLSTSISTMMLSFQCYYIDSNKKKVIEAVEKKQDQLSASNAELILSQANLAIKNTELERKNKELEQFAFVASHDLQEPIGTSNNFAQLLQHQYSDVLDERGEKYLSYIIQSSERMNVLIKDLLDYSRIGYEEERVLIDCNQLIKKITTDWRAVIYESQARIEVENLPAILGYPVGIKQLFQNLIANGIKFNRLGVKPVIHIRCTKEDQYFHFTVADNGIGISKEYYDRIFLIFQRLHTRSEYEGSGIGLSHSKKIVELHDGKIWLESTPMEGTTFHFTIA